MKVEVSVLPNGLAIQCCNHYSGSMSDFGIIQHRCEDYAKLLKKKSNEGGILENGMHIERYPVDWAFVADKRYQELLDLLRTIHPIKKPPRDVLSISDEAFN